MCVRGAWLAISKLGFPNACFPRGSFPPPRFFPGLPVTATASRQGVRGPAQRPQGQAAIAPPPEALLRGGAWGSRDTPAPPTRWACPALAPPPPAGARGWVPSGEKPAVSLRVAAAPGTVELGPPFAWEFCSRFGSAVTPQRAGPAAAMVAKDYPFYLSVKRANCSLEVPPASSPAKDAEVGAPPGLSGPAPCHSRPLFPLLLLSVSHTYSLLPLSLSPFCALPVDQACAAAFSLSLRLSTREQQPFAPAPPLPPTLPHPCFLQGSQTVNLLQRPGRGTSYCIRRPSSGKSYSKGPFPLAGGWVSHLSGLATKATAFLHVTCGHGVSQLVVWGLNDHLSASHMGPESELKSRGQGEAVLDH